MYKCVWRPGSARTHWGASALPETSIAAIWGGVLLLRGREERGGKEGEKGIGKGTVRGEIAFALFNFWLRA